MLRALEHHVLEEMSETGASSTLVCGPDVIPQVYRNERKAVVLGEDDLEAILQGVFLKLDLGSGDGSLFRGVQ
jgi:hypothetical protein